MILLQGSLLAFTSWDLGPLYLPYTLLYSLTLMRLQMSFILGSLELVLYTLLVPRLPLVVVDAFRPQIFSLMYIFPRLTMTVPAPVPNLLAWISPLLLGCQLLHRGIFPSLSVMIWNIISPRGSFLLRIAIFFHVCLLLVQCTSLHLQKSTLARTLLFPTGLQPFAILPLILVLGFHIF